MVELWLLSLSVLPLPSILSTLSSPSTDRLYAVLDHSADQGHTRADLSMHCPNLRHFSRSLDSRTADWIIWRRARVTFPFAPRNNGVLRGLEYPETQ